MNTKKIERSYDIVNGPSKDLLFDACKYAYSKIAKIGLDFAVSAGYTMPRHDPSAAYTPVSMTDVVIGGIQHEDGSGENLNIHGFCKVAPRRGAEETKYCGFRAYYNTKTRNGRITFFE